MDRRRHPQSQHDQRAAPRHAAVESTKGEANGRGAIFPREEQAAAEARRRNSEQDEGEAAWIPTPLTTGDWEVRRSAILVATCAAPAEGVRPLSSSQLDAAADRYEAVVRRIAADNRVRKRTARRWFKEMLKFLDVCYAAEETVSPSPKVDKAWHAFLLFTRDYAAYCGERFGRFVHHEPMDSSDPAAYKRTHREARLRYGELNPRIWPRPRAVARPRWEPGHPHGGCFGAGHPGGCGGGGCGGGGCGGGGCGGS